MYIAEFRVMVKKLTLIFDHNHPKTSNNKHDWTPIKYLNVLHHNRTQKQYFFLNTSQKYYYFLFCILRTCLSVFIKKDNASI